jgi:trimethylguanosine synthase
MPNLLVVQARLKDAHLLHRGLTSPQQPHAAEHSARVYTEAHVEAAPDRLPEEVDSAFSNDSATAGEMLLDDDSQRELEAMAALGLPVSFSGGGFTASQLAVSSQQRQPGAHSGVSPCSGRSPQHRDNVELAGRSMQPCGTHVRFDEQMETVVLPQELPAASGDDPHAKYWAQRFRFFSRFDRGCALHGEMWFSVTPEVIARHQARHMRRLRRQHHPRKGKDETAVVIDAFAGCGGNAIAFAIEGAYVLACDLSMSHLDMARQNAAVYDVSQYIDFVAADWTSLNSAMARHGRTGLAHGVFLSPPWGGPNYAEAGTFDLLHAPLASGHTAPQLVSAALQLAPQVAAFLPRTVCADHVDSMACEAGATHAVLEEDYLNDKLKAVTLFVTRA